METLPSGQAEHATGHGLSWLSIFRLGMVQIALGSIAVLTTSTLNRVMVVELALAAIVPGALVGLHYGVQISRPLWGFGSDRDNAVPNARSRWIVGGMMVLALAAIGAAASTFLLESNLWLGLLASIVAFTFIGFGVGCSGTSLLALLANRTAPTRRPAAASIVWVLMIVGIIFTAIMGSIFLDPYTHNRLIALTACAAGAAVTLTIIALWGVERRSKPATIRPANLVEPTFREALTEVWEDRQARLFTAFVFLSMLAYFTQDLILEPLGGLLFEMSVGETTALASTQHQGVLMGMLVAGGLGTYLSRRYPSILRRMIVIGCIGSGIALAGLGMAAIAAPDWPLKTNIFLLGLANGTFAVAAIGTMMSLAGRGKNSREGVRMGVWGAAQAVAGGLGIVFGTIMFDVTRFITASDGTAFATVFTIEAGMFLASAALAVAMSKTFAAQPTHLDDDKSFEAGLTPAE
ncbi:MAG: BCD family MFS transporter [Pseudomonadota bacterium]